MTCTIEGCDRKHVAKSLCQKHYVSARREAVGREDERKPIACTHCGTIVLKVPNKRYRPFCDLTCRDLYMIENKQGAYGQTRKERPPKEPRDLRSPLRRALEDGDRAGVIAAIKSHCDVRPSGCWEWQRKLDKSGYATVQVGGRRMAVHRLALEARIGRPLRKQAAHHACANSFCVNPTHLQPVTAAANGAEMLARNYMVQRIADLEAALVRLDPTHPLLGEVSTSLVA